MKESDLLAYVKRKRLLWFWQTVANTLSFNALAFANRFLVAEIQKLFRIILVVVGTATIISAVVFVLTDASLEKLQKNSEPGSKNSSPSGNSHKEG